MTRPTWDDKELLELEMECASSFEVELPGDDTTIIIPPGAEGDGRRHE